MPRLLIVTTNFPRWEGDPHSPWLVHLLALLQERGFEIEVLAPAYAGSRPHSIHGWPVHRFRYAPARWETLTHDEGAPNKIRRNPLYLLLLPIYLLAGALAAWAVARRGRFDVIHVHWPVPQGVLGLAARLAGSGRLVATFYGADLVMARRLAPARAFVRYFARRCKAVAAISTFTARETRAIAGVEPHIIPYGVALPGEDTETRVEPGLVLNVGRLVERKGQAYLIEAMRFLAHRPDAHLVIVGEGHERLLLEETIRRYGLEDRVKLAGRVSDETLEMLYARCQVFVLPSIVDSSGDTEMLGMVSLEAMRYRKPVIATRVGGISDIVVDNESGLLVEQRDPEALAAAIDRVLGDPELAGRLGQCGYVYAREHFAWPAVVRETLALYGMDDDRSLGH